ncbi:endonuclease/exonuclease/phosphatase family protein [Candidatus Viadribacter manganicus]|uniref:endonuclease/exonuclease/phosphatase family protein n=1 Tax=Candidatus Viadribacter manganicus TaxID=1759059 RepID=UPI0012E9DC44|nr:hypothetical protein [Candidatus Viadribacter manganicus]
MNIVTYNLRQGGRGDAHFDRIVEQLKPDLLLLQEVIEPVRFSTSARWRVAWSNAEAKGEKLAWGSAAMSLGPGAIAIDLPQFSGWVSALELNEFTGPDGNARRIRIFSVHAPSGAGSYPKVVNSILDTIAPFSADCDVIVGGDFNLTVGARHVSEARKTSRADQQVQERLRDEFGLMNCWQAANPDQALPQTLRWAKEPTFPYHCDGLFVPVSWREHLRACNVVSGPEWNAFSDHNPVVAEFGKFARTD